MTTSAGKVDEQSIPPSPSVPFRQWPAIFTNRAKRADE
mgnify:CR=1 FL=1